MSVPLPALLPQYPLQSHNTFGFAATARFAARVTDEAQLPALFVQARQLDLPVLPIGGGSNLVLAHDLDGLALLIAMAGREIVATTDDAVLIDAGAGENWHDFVAWTLAQRLPGLENLALIPGTVGAAPVQNIGAYGAEAGQFIDGVRAWDRQRDGFVWIAGADCAFAYRDSVFKHDPDRYLITRVRFRLPRRWQPQADYADLREQLAAAGVAQPTAQQIFDAVVAIRRRKLPDPAVLGNAGSFFHNPVVAADQFLQLQRAHPGIVSYPQPDGRVKLAAGWLVDQCGFKGLRDGAVGVHDRQALVLVHFGGGTGTRLLALAERIRAAVAERFGVALTIEPKIV